MPLGTGPCSAFAMPAPISAAIHDASANFFIDSVLPIVGFCWMGRVCDAPPPKEFMLGSRAHAYESACIRIVGKDCDIAVSAGMPAMPAQNIGVEERRSCTDVADRRPAFI